MFKLIFLVLILLTSFMLGPILSNYQGHITIQANSWKLETSILSSFITLVLVIFSLLIAQCFLQHVYYVALFVYDHFLGKKKGER